MYEQSVQDKEFISFKKHINTLCCMFMCVWMAIPFFRVHTGVNVLLLFFLVWFVTTDLRWVFDKLSWDIIFIFIFFITFIPYYLFGNLEYGIYGSKIILVNFPLFFLGIIVNHYYMYFKKDYKVLGKIAIVSLTSYLIGSFQTYLGLLKYPMASRHLAGFVSQHLELKELYNSLGIGGFGHVSACGFVLIASIYLIRKKESKLGLKYRIISLFSIVIIFLMIIKASYTITLIIAFLGISLALLPKNHKVFALILYIITFLLVLLPQRIIGKLLFIVADFFSNNEILHMKFLSLSNNFIYGGSLSESTNRVELYMTSLSTFLKQPLFGIYGPLGNSNNIGYHTIGGHSGWLDLLAFYGLFAGIPLFFILFFNIKKNLTFYKGTKYYRYIFIAYLFFVIYGFINPVISVYEIGFVVLFVIPAIPFIPYVFNKTNIEKDS